jgi:hypothetical protein
LSYIDQRILQAHTFRHPFSQGLIQIHRSRITNSLELLVVRYVNMSAQIVRRKAQSDDETFVTEYLLLVTENGICELRVENLGCGRLLVAWFD